MNHPAKIHIEIRDVKDEDLPSIQIIYAEEVLHGVSSWEEVPPNLTEIIKRRDTIVSAGFPYRVAVRHGKVIGYSHASAYRSRSGYRFTVENSIYISKTERRCGSGKLLLSDIIKICTAQGYRQMIAVVGDSENAMSIDFHRKMGFKHTGSIKAIGYKFGRWMDSVLLQLPLGDSNKSHPKK
jgi:L-amino acid N-acyltransferase YncA